jgi:superfamily II DNA or RNA helicase
MAQLLTIFGPLNNPVVCKEHQRSVAETMLAGQRGLLVAHSVGTGKTLTAIATAANCLRHSADTGVDNVLIICPKALSGTDGQWNRERKRFLQQR